MQLTGAEIVIRCLQEEGVEYVFGYPGGAVLNIYDEVFKQDKFKHVLVRHEQGAVHAADGYSRSSHKVGVALVTSGPGVTNAVTGIATAYMDSIPLVILTGQVPTHAIGQDAFQECDTVGITRPCVKHNFLVKTVEELAVTIKKAFYLAATGRPGPVLVDIPKDVTQKSAEFNYPKTIALRSYNPVTRGHAGQIKKAVQLLLEAKRPMIYTGGGVILNNAAPQLTRLVRLLGFPCTNTLMGLGGFPGTDPQFTGMLGMHGTFESNMAMQNCDVLLAVGARFDDRVIGNPAALLPRRPAHHSHRYRSVVHFQAGQGRRAHRRLRRRRARRNAQADRIDQPTARPRGAEGLVGRDQGVAAQGLPQVRPQERADQAADWSSRSSTRSPRATRS